MPLEHISLRADAKQPWRCTETKFSKGSERLKQHGRIAACKSGQQLSGAASRRTAVQTSQRARTHARTERRQVGLEENPVRCEHPTNCSGERGWVRTSEREGRREGWRREKELLSDYYPSVTGLLGSCYGYGDSRLSVLLTIANKASIQLWSTM